MAYDLGDTLPFSAKLYDKDPTQGGVLVNAQSAALTITLPDGTTTAPSVTNPPAVTGTYEYPYASTQEGPHQGRWVFTLPGGATTTYVEMFDVRPAYPRYIISLADAKAQQNIDSNAQDEELRPFIEATTAVIERHTGKTIVRKTITERVCASWSNELWLNHRPILSVTSIATTDGLTTWNVGASYVDIDPDLGRIRVLSGNYWSGNLVVTYVAGMTSIPPEYTMAARIIVQHLWQTQRGSGGPAIPGGMDVTPGLGYAIPNRALELLGPTPPMVA